MTARASLLQLPVAKKLKMIDELWESISEKDLLIDPGQIKTAKTRLAELKANPSIGLSYEQLKARLG